MRLTGSISSMNKKFEKEILNLRPEWRLCGHYFCMMPVDLIVTGFTWHKSSAGVERVSESLDPAWLCHDVTRARTHG